MRFLLLHLSLFAGVLSCWAQPPVLSATQEVSISLPRTIQPMPRVRDGFTWRGIKGWLWTPDQYLAEIPVMAEYRLNFLMSCYGSLFRGLDENPPRWKNPWWEPLPDGMRRGFEAMVESCRKHRITFCFSINPNLASTRPLRYDSDADFAALWRHFAWMQGLGVHWFCVSLDDISKGIDAEGQARLLNRLLAKLREHDPEAQLITTLPYYWGMGEKPEERAFFDIIARDLHPDVYIFWTGRGVINVAITREEAEAYQAAVKHRLFLWDNYPVNDAHPTMNLGPLAGRDADLPAAIDGYMANSMCTQNEAGRIPMWTVAAYANDPRHYEPSRAIGQAILHQARSRAQREALCELVQLYPGWIPYGQTDLRWNPLRARFDAFATAPGGRADSERLLERMRTVNNAMQREFPDGFPAARKTLAADMTRLTENYRTTYGDHRP